MIRNLIYYAYINTKVSPHIYNHLYLLRKYKDIFNGNIIIYIATDDEITIDVEDKLKSHFDFMPKRITMIKIVKNSKINRESEYFLHQLADLKLITDRNTITFYAHSKGSTYQVEDNILKWITSMYFFNMENITDVENQLLDKTFAGIFKMNNPCPPWINVNWHFSGTFWWFNTDKLFSIKNWNRVDTTGKFSYNGEDFSNGRFALESYPGSLVDTTQSYISENLFNDYSNSFLPIGFISHDLRYDFYWKNVFSENVISKIKLEKFNQLIDDIKNNKTL